MTVIMYYLNEPVKRMEVYETEKWRAIREKLKSSLGLNDSNLQEAITYICKTGSP